MHFTLCGNMKKRIALISLFVAVLLILAWGMGGRTGFDYSLTCTKCLDSSHVIERKFLGLTYNKTVTPRAKQPGYSEITGHECRHVYHKGGYGRSSISWFGGGIGCGMTAEGMVFRDRNQAVKHTFELYRRLGNKPLAAKTLALIDRLLPPDFDWKASRGRSELLGEMAGFAWVFGETSSEAAWKKLLDETGH